MSAVAGPEPGSALERVLEYTCKQRSAGELGADATADAGERPGPSLHVIDLLRQYKPFVAPLIPSSRISQVTHCYAFASNESRWTRTATVEVRTELGEKLRAKDLQIEFAGPLLPDGSGPFRVPIATASDAASHYLPLPSCGNEDVQAQASGALRVSFRFPPIVSAFHNQTYFADAKIRYRQDTPLCDLGETLLCFEVVPLDARKLIKALATGEE